MLNKSKTYEHKCANCGTIFDSEIPNVTVEKNGIKIDFLECPTCQSDLQRDLKLQIESLKALIKIQYRDKAFIGQLISIIEEEINDGLTRDNLHLFNELFNKVFEKDENVVIRNINNIAKIQDTKRKHPLVRITSEEIKPIIVKTKKKGILKLLRDLGKKKIEVPIEAGLFERQKGFLARILKFWEEDTRSLEEMQMIVFNELKKGVDSDKEKVFSDLYNKVIEQNEEEIVKLIIRIKETQEDKIRCFVETRHAA